MGKEFNPQRKTASMADVDGNPINGKVVKTKPSAGRDALYASNSAVPKTPVPADKKKASSNRKKALNQKANLNGQASHKNSRAGSATSKNS